MMHTGNQHEQQAELARLRERTAGPPGSLDSVIASMELAELCLNTDPRMAEEYLGRFFENAYRMIQGTRLPGSILTFCVNPLEPESLTKIERALEHGRELSCELGKRLANATPPPACFTNPTGGHIRPADAWGSGDYLAPRPPGLHAGVDYLGELGAPVYAGIGGNIEMINEGVRITGRSGGILYTVREVHVNALANLPDKVRCGQQVATVADLTGIYPGIKNHCHIEIYQQPGDIRLDPTPFFGR